MVPVPSRARVAATATAGIATAGILAVALLAGCTATNPAPAPSTATSAPTASGAPTPAPTAPTAPVLVPDGTAEQNLPLFTSVTKRIWSGAHRAEGRAYIDALVAAGFAKSEMQVTEDRSTVGNPAESIQFSVLWKATECLVGQVGPATGTPVTTVLPALGDGKCLLGRTRPIDW